MTDNKDTIYVDIDDEITGIIDKVRGSGGKIVALVLPKRAAVFQSIVNMKLLKRAADESKKHLVLITSEAGLLPLAGAAGIHVAKTLTSKPEIPGAPSLEEESDEAIEETSEEMPVTAETAGDKSIGELAAAAPAAEEGMETLELDDDELPEDVTPPAGKKDFTPPKGKKNNKFKIPDFDRFRLLLVAGIGALVLLIIFLILAFTVLPKATVNIKTDAQAISVDQNLNLSTTATDLDLSSNTVPAKLSQQQKTYTETVPTTGQKNNGNKAQGNVSMSATKCGGNPFIAPNDVPAGTGVSANGNTYITQDDVSFHGTGTNSSGCFTYAGNGSAGIVAQSPGSSFNTGNGSVFSVAGRSDVSASGSASGGSDDIQQVVSQADINTAKAKVNTSDPDVKKSLQKDLKDNHYFPINATFSAGTPTVTTSAEVGDKANTVTVTEVVTYTMFGAREDDLKALVDNAVKDQIDTSKQSILDEGLDTATFNINTQNTKSAALTMATTATAGPELNLDDIKQQAAGKKPGDVKNQLQTNPNVVSVDVKLSPFWVNSVPKKTSKIKVVIAKPTAPAKNNSNANNP